jgi:hypothetical protein
MSSPRRFTRYGGNVRAGRAGSLGRMTHHWTI